MTIRVMRLEDYDQVWALWMSSKNMGFNHLDDSREGITAYLRRNPATSFVALDGEKVIGVILALEAEGIHKVALLVFHRNEAGNAFWEKNGFTVREDVAYRNRSLTELIRIDT